jgi:S1-C subfamily serine protease
MRLKTLSLIGLSMILVCIPLSGYIAQDQDDNVLLERYKQSVITFVAFNIVKSEIAKGTGFLIGKDILATNYHLLSQANSAEGINYKGKKIKFQGIISVDKDLDLVLVKVKSKEPALILGSANELKYGQKIIALGGNRFGELESFSGEVNIFLFHPTTLIYSLKAVQSPSSKNKRQ